MSAARCSQCLAEFEVPDGEPTAVFRSCEYNPGRPAAHYAIVNGIYTNTVYHHCRSGVSQDEA